MNLKQLKALKTIPVIRTDSSFLSDEEKETLLIAQAKEQGYSLSKKEEDMSTINYTFINPSKETEVRMYVPNPAKFSIKDINREVISYRIIGDTVIAKVKGDTLHYTLTKNKLAKELTGNLVFRSKDYYFEYTTSDNTTEKIYGEPLKSAMLSGDTITPCPNITYTINSEV